MLLHAKIDGALLCVFMKAKLTVSPLCCNFLCNMLNCLPVFCCELFHLFRWYFVVICVFFCGFQKLLFFVTI